MPKLTITAASAVFMLGVESVFPVAQQLKGFAVDEAFDTEPADAAVVEVGVDSIGVAGWVPRTVKQTIVLMASSPSFLLFEDWIAAQDQLNEILYAFASISIPAIQRKYTCVQGSLTRFPSLPNARRTLQQRQFEITWMPIGIGQPAITSGPL